MIDLRAGWSGLTALLVLGALFGAFPSAAGEYWYIPGQAQPGAAGTLDPNAHPEVSGRSATKLLDPNAAPAAASPDNQPIDLNWQMQGFGLKLGLEDPHHRPGQPALPDGAQTAPKILGGEQKRMCIWYADAGDEHRCKLGPMGAMVPTGGPCLCPRGRKVGTVEMVPMWMSER